MHQPLQPQEMHSGIVYKCTKVDNCLYTVQSESHYKEHYKYAHRNSKTVPCYDCGLMFQTCSHRNNQRTAIISELQMDSLLQVNVFTLPRWFTLFTRFILFSIVKGCFDKVCFCQ